jgi:hypothetical protein
MGQSTTVWLGLRSGFDAGARLRQGYGEVSPQLAAFLASGGGEKRLVRACADDAGGG